MAQDEPKVCGTPSPMCGNCGGTGLCVCAVTRQHGVTRLWKPGEDVPVYRAVLPCPCRGMPSNETQRQQLAHVLTSQGLYAKDWMGRRGVKSAQFIPVRVAREIFINALRLNSSGTQTQEARLKRAKRFVSIVVESFNRVMHAQEQPSVVIRDMVERYSNSPIGRSMLEAMSGREA